MTRKRPPTFRHDSLTYLDVANVLRQARKPLTLKEIDALRDGYTTTVPQVLRQMVSEGRVRKVNRSVMAYQLVKR